MEVCDREQAQVKVDASKSGWCVARRAHTNPRSRIALPVGEVIPLRPRGSNSRSWHTFKPPGAGNGGSEPPKRTGRSRLFRLVAAVGLVCALLMVAHGMGGSRSQAPDAARPYQPAVSRGTPGEVQRVPAALAPVPDAEVTAEDPEGVAGTVADTTGRPAAGAAASGNTVVTEIPLASPGSGETIRMLATAYTLACGNGDGVTATGTTPRPGIIAVDPRVIAHDTLVYIDDYGYFRAEDTGGVIKGDRIDVFMHSRADAMSFGKRWVDVKIIGKFEEPGLVKRFP